MNVLVIAPHPDDEAIGLGGSIKIHVDQGDHVKVVFVTSGERAIETTAYERIEEAKKAQEILGYQEHNFLGFQDGKLQEARYQLKDAFLSLLETPYDVVYIPNKEDKHEDHWAVYDAFWVALGLTKGKKPIPEHVFMYEVWTPLVDFTDLQQITEVIEYKMAAIRAHYSQDSRNNFSQGAIGLAKYRAVMTGWKQGYVEVFQKVEI